MSDLKQLLDVDRLRWRLLAGCVTLAIIVSVIFIVSAYRLSRDMGETIERDALAKEAQFLLNHLENHYSPQVQDWQTLLNQIANADTVGIVVIGEPGQRYFINPSDKKPLLSSLIQSINNSQHHGELSFENAAYFWTYRRSEDSPLSLILMHRIASLETALNYIGRRLSITAFLTFWGAVWLALIISAAIAKRVEKSNQKLAFLATHDPLTHSFNRNYLVGEVRSFLQQENKKTETSGAALLLIDLNKFKEVNDNLGHAVGDEVLAAIANRLRNAVKGNADIIRHGGDEFIAWAKGSDRLDIRKFAEKIAKVCHQPIKIGEEYFAVSASVGVAMYPDDGDDIDTLLRHADIAMYRAKSLRQPFAFYMPQDDSLNTLRLKLRSQLNSAIENEQFVLFYQPKIILLNGTIIGVEALVRWEHPQEGLLAPNLFIDLIEQSGVVHEFSRYILKKAIQQAAVWQEQNFNLAVAVNLSPYNMTDTTLPSFIINQLGHFRVTPKHLEIELTESATMVELETTAKMFEQLQAIGVQVCIDDFGTGMSSLAYLKSLNVDYVKIDRSFVTDIAESRQNKAIVEGIVSLCRHMQKAVVVEGVETQRQLQILQGIGCEYAQGYLFGKPVPPEKLALHQPTQIASTL